MVTVIKYPDEKSTQSIMFYVLFEHMEAGIDTKKLDSLPEAMKHVVDVKTYVLIANIEFFRSFCENTVFPPEKLTTPDEESIRILHELTLDLLNNQNKYQYILEQILERVNFMRLLVKNSDPENKPFLISMAKMIVDFCNTELSGIKKDQNKE